jgi:aminopeptidase N
MPKNEPRMKTKTPRTIWLKDYAPPSHLVETVDLDIALEATQTRVRTRLKIASNPKAKLAKTAKVSTGLILNGTGFELESVALNGRRLERGSYLVTDETLTLPNPPVSAFELETVTIVNASVNKSLQGLYQSKGVYCTQCEAEGFRHITYMLDRPDVLARYTVRLEAAVKDAPVLLANGNLVERGTLAKGRHYAVWHDPHPKPCYLFAIVAGDLGSIASQFTTMSGRTVDLRIYVEHGKEARAAWAMDALKRAMAWDEKRFGREYDLDQFNIVAVSDFNMGAMENKGLNIFNDRLILASPETATDAQFEAIESVVAHEYFHNWTGNRITCRDWFQLCLKEGLTVYRDQEFSADENSRTVQRISDVRQLKALQFPEDQGPLAHPVRPESYIEINNFYTATVYEKGAELVRMLETILGPDGFGAGLELYFTRHDGDAATIEDFLACFAEVSGQDLTQFKRWYSQRGTPQLDCKTTYDRRTSSLTVTLTQVPPSLPPPLKPSALPFSIPVRIGLVGPDGRDMPLNPTHVQSLRGDVVMLTKAQQSIRFEGLAARPVVSVLRGFSAPVALTAGTTDRELAFLATHDCDLFNRWQAMQQVGMRTLLRTYAALKDAKRPGRSLTFARTLSHCVADETLEPAYRAELMRIPSVSDLMREAGSDMDPDLAARAHRHVMATVVASLSDRLDALYQALRPGRSDSLQTASAGRRALRNTALGLLSCRRQSGDSERLRRHYESAQTMTDQAHALYLISHHNSPERDDCFNDFLARWRSDDLVIDNWFAAQAQANRPSALDDVTGLLGHSLFKITTPNKVRALIGTFATANPEQFHRRDGAGYAFVAEQVVAIDRFNPQVAARLATCFRTWRTLEPGRRRTASASLDTIAQSPGLSRNVFEVVSKMRDE